MRTLQIRCLYFAARCPLNNRSWRMGCIFQVCKTKTNRQKDAQVLCSLYFSWWETVITIELPSYVSKEHGEKARVSSSFLLAFRYVIAFKTNSDEKGKFSAVFEIINKRLARSAIYSSMSSRARGWHRLDFNERWPQG